MTDNDQLTTKPKDTGFMTWLVKLVLVLLGAGSFSMWFFMTTMLAWVIVTAIMTQSSDTAVNGETLRPILDSLRYSTRVFGSRQPAPAVLTNLINLGLFCFNVAIGWYWVSRDRCGRFALLLLSEFLLIVFFLLALALRIAQSPYAATRNSFNIF